MPDRPITVDRVQDTARWVAMARALESERPDALFHDPFARTLAGPVGAELVQRLSGKATGTWPIVARTHIVDRLVLEAIQDGADAVVNLAAGLDSRPQRMALPPSLHWIEVDHADVIAEKQALLAGQAPVCHLERHALDLSQGEARRELFGSLGSRFQKVLILTEGLLVYLPPPVALELGRDLRAFPKLFRWIADLNNAAVNRFVAKRTGSAMQGTAQFLFGPDDGPRVFEPMGWTVRSAKSIFKAAGQLKRLPFPMSLFARLPEPAYGNPKRPWSGVCVFEPSNASGARSP